MLKQLIPIFQVSFDMPNLLQVYLCIAHCCYYKKDYSNCIDHCRAVLYLTESYMFHDQKVMGQVLQLLSQAQVLTGNYRESLTTLNFLLEFAFNTKD